MHAYVERDVAVIAVCGKICDAYEGFWMVRKDWKRTCVLAERITDREAVVGLQESEVISCKETWANRDEKERFDSATEIECIWQITKSERTKVKRYWQQTFGLVVYIHVIIHVDSHRQRLQDVLKNLVHASGQSVTKYVGGKMERTHLRIPTMFKCTP